MFGLRRAALRTLIQPTRQSLTIRPVSRFASLRTQKPVATRAFHQSRSWLAEEDQRASAGESAEKTSPEIRGESVGSTEVSDGAKETTSTSASGPSISGLAEQAKNAAAGAVERTQEVVSGVVGRAQAAAGESSASVTRSNTVFVGNLFYEATASELEAEFGRIGEVRSCRLIKDGSGRSKGFGFVEFSTKEQAERAARELDSKIFQGRRIAVRIHIPRPRVATHEFRQSPPSDTLYIGNMSYEMSDRDLNDLFRDIRDVLDVRVAIDRRSGQPRGFAHADFADVAAATRAKEILQQKVIFGRTLRVDYGKSVNRNREDGETQEL